MTHIQDCFLYLLRLGLWGKVQEQHEIYLNQDEWTAVHQMAIIQTVQGIVYDGVRLLPEMQQPSPELLAQWGVEVKMVEQENRKQLVQLTQLHYLYEQEGGIRFCLVKGQGVARHYRNPLHRFCGDFDLWFGTAERVEQANKLIESKGIAVRRGATDDAEYYWNGTSVEHQTYIITLHNPFRQKSIRRWEAKAFEQSDEYPTALADLLLQMVHILKHHINGGGLGFRHICDLAVSMVSRNYDAAELRQLARQWGLYRWGVLLCSLIHDILEVPVQQLPFPCTADSKLLFEETWLSGNFGIGTGTTRPKKWWASKIYTIGKVKHKMKVFFQAAPGECFWNTMSMVGYNIGNLQKLIIARKNEDK